MSRVYLSLGSNIDPERHLRNAVDSLSRASDILKISPVYQSKPLGFEGDHFLNLVVALETAMRVGDLRQECKRIELENGRSTGDPRFSSRTLDIDILLYDQLTGTIDGVTLPRDEILTSAFVLKPLTDIAPRLHHPELGQTFESLWKQFDQSSQAIWPVSFNWQSDAPSAIDSDDLSGNIR